ncbi:18696_t:CDS:2, partial [Acaulospora morrowiae]
MLILETKCGSLFDSVTVISAMKNFVILVGKSTGSSTGPTISDSHFVSRIDILSQRSSIRFSEYFGISILSEDEIMGGLHGRGCEQIVNVTIGDRDDHNGKCLVWIKELMNIEKKLLRAIKIDAPGAVLMKEDVFFRLSRELNISNKDNPIDVDDDTTLTEDELVNDIHIKGINQPQGEKTVLSTCVDQDNQPQGEETVPLTGVDRDNQPQVEEIVPLTGVNRDNQPREKETVPSTGVDQDNQPREKETASSIGFDHSDESQGGKTDETSSSASADQSYQLQRRNPSRNLKLNKFFRVSKGKITKDVQFNINKRKLKNRQDKGKGEGNVEDWSNCEKCYGLRKQFCKFCGCFKCERKVDPAHILLCDGNCGNGYHTYCLKPPIDEIPSGNWYCDKCRSLNAKQVESESSGSKGKEVVSTSDEIQVPLERNDSLGLSQPMSGIVILSRGSLIDIDSLKLTNDNQQSDTDIYDSSSRAYMLKKIFTDVTTDQLNICGDQLFLRNDSIESFLISNFDSLFDDNDIYFSSVSLPSLPSHLILDVETLENYFKEWIIQYDKLGLKNKVPPTSKILRGLVAEKMITILCIDGRQERRYWTGMWKLIELLHITRCRVDFLMKAQINATFLMTASISDYDKFLKILLDDEKASHKNPLFDELLMQK